MSAAKPTIAILLTLALFTEPARGQLPYEYSYDNVDRLAAIAGFDAGGEINGGLNDGIGFLGDENDATSVLWDVGQAGTIFLDQSGDPTLSQPQITLSLSGGAADLQNVAIYYFERSSSGVSSPEQISATINGETRTIYSFTGQIDDSFSDGPLGMAATGVGEIRVAGIDLTGLNSDAIQLDFLNQVSFTGAGEWTGLTEIVVNDPALVLPTTLNLNARLDRDTGELFIENLGSDPVSLKGYSITSAAGALSPVGWTSIADTYDSDSGGGTVVDANDTWTNLTDQGSTTSLELSEFQFGTGDGAVIEGGSTLSLGNAWARSPFDDLAFEYVDPATGEIVTSGVLVEGAGLTRSDLDADGDIDADDWSAYSAGLSADLSAQTVAGAYLLGDLDGDLDNDLQDLRLFKADFDAAQGAGAFEAMLVGAVPTPGGFGLTAIAVVGIAVTRRQAICRLLVLAAVIGVPAAADAQLLGLYRFEADGEGAPLGATTLGVGDTVLDSARRESHAAVVVGDFDVTIGQPGFGNAGQFNASGVAQALFGGFDQVADDFAIAAWLRVEPTPGTANAYYVTNYDDADGGNQLSLIYDFVDENVELFAIGGPQPRPGSELPVVDSEWHHVVYTRTGDDFDAYFDGVKTDISVLAGSIGLLPNTISIGGSTFGGGANFYNGLADDIAYFDQGLNQSQVDDIMAGDFSEFIDLLDIEVNSGSGTITLKNNDTAPITIDGYQVVSAAESLDSAAWNSLSDQGLDAIGSGPGEGWTEGGGSNPGEVSEGFFLGASTIEAGASVSLGSLYDSSVDARDLVFRFTNEAGVFRGDVTYVDPIGDYNGDGAIDAADYTVWRDTLGDTVAAGTGADGNGDGVINQADYDLWSSSYGSSTANGTSIPEPVGFTVVLMGALAVAGARGRRRQGAAIALLIGLTAVTLFAPHTSEAAFGLDRDYQLGDDPLEGASAGLVVGTGPDNEVEDFTLDSAGADLTNFGDFQDLERGATPSPSNAPIYVSVTDRTGGANDLGVRFDGDGDFLFGDRLGLPDTSEPAIFGEDGFDPVDYAGLSNRGLQFWAKPDAAGAETTQALVMDTNQHGVMISDNDTWVMRYAGADTDTGVTVDFDSWSHVMLVRPNGAANGAQLYVNGVAVANQLTGYNGADNAPLVLGANTGDVTLDPPETAPGTQDFYTGALDDVTLFVFGTTSNGTEYGAFDYATDNEFAASALSGVAGDVNQDGDLNLADLDDFVAGWFRRNEIGGGLVGDLTTVLAGDLNFDGVTDLRDAVVLDAALVEAGLPAAIAFASDGSPFVAITPEPSGMALVMLIAACGVSRRRMA